MDQSEAGIECWLSAVTTSGQRDPENWLAKADEANVPGRSRQWLEAALIARQNAMAAELEGLKRPADFYWSSLATALSNIDNPDAAVLGSAIDGERPAWSGLAMQAFVLPILSVSDSCERNDPRQVSIIPTARRVWRAISTDDQSVFYEKVFEQTLLELAVRNGLDDLAANQRKVLAMRPEAAFQEREAFVERLTSSLLSTISKDGSRLTAAQDLKKCRAALRELDEFRKVWPADFGAFDGVSLFSSIAAMRALAVDDFDTAVLNIQRAEAFGDRGESIVGLRDQIQDQVKGAAEQIEEAYQQAICTPGMSLSSEGQRLRSNLKQAQNRIANGWDDSLNAIPPLRAKALTHRVWDRLTAGISAASPSEGTRKAFLTLINSIDLQDSTAIRAAIENHADPHIAGFDAEALAGRMVNLASSEPMDYPAPTSFALASLDLPTAAFRKRGNAPFGPWLKTSGGRGAVALVSAAALALMGAVGVAGHDAFQRQQKTASFSKIVAATQALNEEALLSAQREYNTIALTYAAEDLASPNVAGALSVLRQRRAMQERDRAVATLNAAIERERPDMVLFAAEYFFQQLIRDAEDQRRYEVGEHYGEAFRWWLMNDYEPDVPDHEKRIAAYNTYLDYWER